MLYAECLLQNKGYVNLKSKMCKLKVNVLHILSFCILLPCEFMGFSRYVDFKCTDIFLSF